MKRLIQKISLLLASILIFLLLFELASRIFLKAAYTHVTDKNGNIVSMQIDPGYPANGLKPFFEGRMISSEFDVSICLDSLGFRKKEHSITKNSDDTIRIVILGDSFMFGWGVESSQIYATELENNLNTLLSQTVITYSLAIPGTGQITQLSLFDQINKYNPNIIIVGMYIADHVSSGNDLIENLNEYYKMDSAIVSKKQTKVIEPDLLRQIRRWLKTNSNLFRFVETRLSAILLAKFSNSINLESDSTVMNQAWVLTDSILAEMQKEAISNNAFLMIQYIPNMLDVAQENSKTYFNLEQICNKNQIHLAPNPINLISVGQSGLDLNEFYFVCDGHWTSRAHKIIAKSSANYLIDLINNSNQ